MVKATIMDVSAKDWATTQWSRCPHQL